LSSVFKTLHYIAFKRRTMQILKTNSIFVALWCVKIKQNAQLKH